MKKFKTESQRVLDLMINSIYTHKEIFLRELLSNASDAIDKLYYKSLNDNLGISKEDLFIKIEADKEKGTLTITDNGIGMTAAELEDNLGVIAKSGSLEFKKQMETKEDMNIIGQFGVGFYSAFMVSDKVEVLSRAYGSEEANLWSSKGAEGYTIEKAEKAERGTTITLYLKKDTEDENYSEFLSEYRIRELVKKYSDYLRYPIKMDVESEKDTEDGKEKEKVIETETLNSMIPLWKKRKADITAEEYIGFYKDAFYDYENPVRYIHTSAEGAVNYTALLYIPAKAPYNYYSKTYEKGLKLYTNGVMITEKCAELLPDYFSFVKGIVDSDLTLNISRETIQHNHQLKKIGVNIEKKIKAELLDILEKERENYLKFYGAFGMQLKYGIYEGWGANKDALKDLIMFTSVLEDKMITLKEYLAAMKEGQKYIYYAPGKTPAAVKALPQAEKVLDLGYDILCFGDDIDEFAIKMLHDYEGKEFRSVSGETGIEEKDKAEENDTDKDLLAFMKETLGDKVTKVVLSKRLKTHAVCLTSEGELSIEMEKVFNSLPDSKGVKAEKVLEINKNHAVYNKLSYLFQTDKDAVKDYSNALYSQARLIEGLPLENPAEYSELILRLISK